MAIWESVVENCLGFPDGLSGPSLFDRSRAHVRRFGPYIRSCPGEMIIAAGQGATAGQAIDCHLFDESLQCHRLPRIGTNEAWVAGASSEMEGRR